MSFALSLLAISLLLRNAWNGESQESQYLAHCIHSLVVSHSLITYVCVEGFRRMIILL